MSSSLYSDSNFERVRHVKQLLAKGEPPWAALQGLDERTIWWILTQARLTPLLSTLPDPTTLLHREDH